MKRILWLLFLLACMAPAAAQGPSTMRTFPSITGTGGIVGLGAASSQYVNATVAVQGYATPNDGGGGVFQWNSTSTATADAGTIFAATGVSTGRWVRQGISGQEYNLLWFGAKCGGQQVTDGISSVTGGLTHTITSASAAWTASMVGWQVVVNGAGSAGAQVVSTIATVTPPGTLTYAATTATAGTGLTVSVYPDDTTPISNWITSTGSAKTVAQMPANGICGFANPGSFVSYNFTGPGLDLNNGQLWLGQTGPVYQTGVVLSFNQVANQGVWDGTISGLYQTNQGIQQGNSAALVFQSASTVTGDFLRNVVITNTKSRSFAFTQPINATLLNVTASFCGDLSYSASYTFMAQCGQIEDPQGWLHITDYKSQGCSQACLIIDDLSAGPLDANLSVNINGFSASDALYYALDLEALKGCTKINNVQINNSAVSPSGNVIGGGIIARNIGCHQASNVVVNSPGQSYVIEDGGSDGSLGNRYVELNDITTLSSGASHNGLLQITSNAGFASTQFLLHNISTDVFSLTTAGTSACSTTIPMTNLISFNDLHVSNLYTGSYDTVYSQQGNASTMYYILGRDSDLGREHVVSANNNPLASDFDFFTVWEQTVTYTGVSRIGRATTTWNNPMTFACPT